VLGRYTTGACVPIELGRDDLRNSIESLEEAQNPGQDRDAEGDSLGY